MLQLHFKAAEDNGLTLLYLGAHCDDIEIGCGGSLLHILTQYNVTKVYWVVFSSNNVRVQEAKTSAGRFLGNTPHKVIIKDFRNGFFPYIGAEVKLFFEELKKTVNPDLIFTHYRRDLHQDHRTVSELTWNTFRDHLILEYEIVKYDGDIGNPNFFVHLEEKYCREKIKTIKDCFRSQQYKTWFDDKSFWSLLRLRGIESNSPSLYAEAFYCRKAII